MQRPISVFVCYAHKDEKYRNDLEKHLALSKRTGMIALWHDRRIEPGANFDSCIESNLKTAQIVLLLVSADFLNSDYCYGVELKFAMQRHAAGNARVIPVIVRPCNWSDAPFGRLQALPKDAVPVASWSSEDEAFTDVAKGIVSAATSLSTTMPAALLPPTRIGSTASRPELPSQATPPHRTNNGHTSQKHSFVGFGFDDAAKAVGSAEMIEVAEPFSKLISTGDNIPVPFYVARLHSGEILYTNSHFQYLFQYDASALRSLPASVLYGDHTGGARRLWADEVDKRCGKVYACEMIYAARDRSQIVALDVARVINPDQQEKIVAGAIVDIGGYVLEQQHLRSYKSAYEELLNLPWQDRNLGMHIIERRDAEHFVVKTTNAFEKQLLGLTEGPFNAEELVPETMRTEFESQLAAKFSGKPLSHSEHTVLSRRDNASLVPVVFHDASIRDREGRICAIATAVQDVRLPADIEEILCTYGINNPLLEQIGIRTFEKVHRNVAWERNPALSKEVSVENAFDLVFTQGNRAFVSELISNGRIVSDDGYLGQTDRTLFSETAADYRHVDIQVLETGERDQRIEKHGCESGRVRVLKVPVYSNDGKRIGVQAYYWDASQTSRVIDDLRKLYQPWSILNSMDTPVFCKDDELRFVYINNAFLQDVRQLTNNPKLDIKDIIGKRDEDIHVEALAKKYARNDKAVLDLPVGTTKIWREPHGPEQTIVEVRKTRTETGILGVFFNVEEAFASPEVIWIDWKLLQIKAGRAVLFQADPQHRGLLLALDKLLAANGEPVGYLEFMDGVENGKAMPQIAQDKLKSNAQTAKMRLDEFLRRDDLAGRFSIITVRNCGYALKVNSPVK